MIVNDFYYNYISKSIQTRPCFLPIQIPSRIKFKQLTCVTTFMLISICSTFLGTGKKSQFYNDENKKVIGKMKDQLKGKIIEEFVAF